MSGFKDRMRAAKRGPGTPVRASDQRVRKDDAGGQRARPDAGAPRDNDRRGPARREDARDQRGRGDARPPVRRDDARPARDDRRDDARPAPRDDRAPTSSDYRDRDDVGSRRTAEPRITGPGERIVYGAGPVRELVTRNPKSVKAIWVDPRRADKSAGDPVAQIVTKARLEGILVEDRDRTSLDRSSEDGRHQGVLAWLGPFAYTPLEQLVKGDEPALLVALDGVEDPRNLGAILRSAYLLGAGGVIIPEHRAAQVSPLVSKTSAGASELLPIAQVGNLVRALEELRELDVWRVAVHATEKAQPIAKIDGRMPLVLVLGGEGDGVRPLVAKHCDFHAVIPMQRSGVGSFNVSVAAALALYELRRQRSAP